MDFSQPGPSVHGIFQARVLMWVAVPFSKMNFGDHKTSVRMFTHQEGKKKERNKAIPFNKSILQGHDFFNLNNLSSNIKMIYCLVLNFASQET